LFGWFRKAYGSFVFLFFQSLISVRSTAPVSEFHQKGINTKQVRRKNKRDSSRVLQLKNFLPVKAGQIVINNKA
jgi:hypothetical protein